jgi:peptidoglycan/xylan/chitin deacetylase (PgdA/CDA1 family)
VQQVLRDFAQRTQLPVHATAFVIASPAARRQIADAEMLGHPWISDTWWQAAVDSGLFHIGNHSWDHVSASVTHAPAEAARRSSSQFIDNAAAANLQVRHAREYIDQVAPNPGSALLAYPYGDYSTYLADEYLPGALNADGAIAAFTAQPAPVTAQTNRWKLPRYTCGTHWKSPEALALLLDD